MNTLECWQAASAAYDTWVCGGTAGVAKTNAIYQSVVEGRDAPSSYSQYSSCADRPHAKLWRFGCRRAFLNREERTPYPKDFKWGANISNMHDLSKGSPCMFAINAQGHRFAVAPGAGWVPLVGDEMLIWNHPLGKDAHALGIVTFDGKLATTSNYGAAGMSAAVFPGAKISSPRSLEFRNNAWWYDKSGVPTRVMRVLRIADYVETFTEVPNFDGIPFDSQFTGEVADHLRGLLNQ